MTKEETDFLQALHEAGHDEENPSLLAKRFLYHITIQPEHYQLFEQFAYKAIKRGHPRLSGWLIANRMRWETAIEQGSNDYKVHNDFIALYTRLFMVRNPQYNGFFQTKTIKELPLL